MDISGNTIFLTGGGSGIGFALATALREAGNEVIICGRNAEKLERAKAQIEGLHALRCDISNAEDVARCVAQLDAEFPEVNVLVNNAGVFNVYPFLDNEDALSLAINEIEVNYVGTARLIKLFLPRLQARDNAAIVNVTSGLAYTPFAPAPSYCASKAALHSLTQSLRHQLKGTNVRVFEVLPPLVDTEMVRDLETLPKMSPEDVAKQVLKGLRRDKFELPVGISKSLRLMSRLAPGMTFKMLNKNT